MSGRRLSPLLCVLGIACSHAPPIRPEQAAPRTPIARAYTVYGSFAEEVPGDLSPTLLLDDAVLTIARDEFCFDLAVRAPRWADQALSAYEYECSVDGPDTVGTVREEEEARESRHPFTGPAPVMVIGAPGGSLEVPVGPREARLFSVVERRGTVCCPAAPTSSLELTLSGQHAGRRESSVRLEWGWQLERR